MGQCVSLAKWGLRLWKIDYYRAFSVRRRIIAKTGRETAPARWCQASTENGDNDDDNILIKRSLIYPGSIITYVISISVKQEVKKTSERNKNKGIREDAGEEK